MKLEIKEKAYQVDFSQIEEGYLYGEAICHAESLGKAKTKLLPEVEGCRTNLFYDDVTFLNIPVIRAKQYDRIIYNEEIITRHELEYKIRVKESDIELNKILKDKTITHCYKKKRGMYYSWENCGYVSYKQNAGVYNKEEAVNYCKGQLDVTCIPIITKEHNDFLFKQIERIKKGVIK
jgi:hypothetical protein